jgi:hypothetical protein
MTVVFGALLPMTNSQPVDNKALSLTQTNNQYA